MAILVALGALLLICVVLWDGFETIILPRRVTRRLRLTNLVYRLSWTPWSAIARKMEGRQRESFLSLYGPLVLLLLMSVWVIALILGFGGLQWALGQITPALEGSNSVVADLYMSGTTFFTLGLGDLVPRTSLARAVTVVEAGTGFGFLALMIAYLPVLYQSFSRREVHVSLLDARASSPPSAVELLRRNYQRPSPDALEQLLYDWERWSAELLESHLSYPSLAYFRSHHDKQSWLAALTTILDVSALVIVGIEGIPAAQAQLTFAMARHAAVDLAQVFNTPPCEPETDRLTPVELARLRDSLETAGMRLREGTAADRQLAELRHAYEPCVHALSEYLLMALPSWIPEDELLDAWQASVWHPTTAASVRS